MKKRTLTYITSITRPLTSSTNTQELAIENGNWWTRKKRSSSTPHLWIPTKIVQSVVIYDPLKEIFKRNYGIDVRKAFSILEYASSLSLFSCLVFANSASEISIKWLYFPQVNSCIRFHAIGKPWMMISAWRMNTPTVHVHGRGRKKDNNPPIEQTPRIGKEGKEMTVSRKGKETRSVSMCGVYGDGGWVVE